MGGLGGAPDKMIGGYSGTGVNVGAHPHFDNWSSPLDKNASTYISLDTGDSEKITYISPSFGGFQVGLSYAPEMDEKTGASRVDADMARHDGIEGAARYSGKFGDVSFGVGVGAYAYQGSNERINAKNEALPHQDISAWAVGSYLDFGGGFRVAAAHKRVTNDAKATRGTTTDLGVRYVHGANQFSVVGVYGEMENSDATRTTVVGGYKMQLGPGVAVHSDLMWTASQSDEDADGKQMEADSLALLTGIKVSF